MSGWRRAALATGLVLLVCRGAGAQRNLEYEVKAAFLYNFLSFVDWPNSAFARQDSPIRVCLFGGDPFRGALSAVATGESVGRRQIELAEVYGAGEATACHAVFFPRAAAPRMAAIVRELGRSPVLIVGEAPDTLRRCGAIAFVLEGERVRFDVNVDAMRERGLRASSRLLRVAREVTDRGAACR